MPLWDKVRQELDRAGDLASGLIDEGKLRHEAFRARQLADKAAQALGYALYRARQQGQDLDADTFARLSSTLAGHEADVTRLEAKLEEMVQRRKSRERTAGSSAETTAGATPSADAPPETPGATP